VDGGCLRRVASDTEDASHVRPHEGGEAMTFLLALDPSDIACWFAAYRSSFEQLMLRRRSGCTIDLAE
jgi:hypothetical protein